MTGAARTQWTPKKAERFLEALAAGHAVAYAAKELRVSRSAIYQHRADDEAFRLAWDAAVSEGTEALEEEARRRAVDGTLKPVFHQGAQVGAIREYSDTLLIFLLKGRKPETYRDNSRVIHAGDADAPVQLLVEVVRDRAPDADH